MFSISSAPYTVYFIFPVVFFYACFLERKEYGENIFLWENLVKTSFCGCEMPRLICVLYQKEELIADEMFAD